MSLLMYVHRETSIKIITDTLATDPEGNPFLFVTKSFIVPHLDMVIGTTGLAAIGQRWIGQVFSEVRCRNIDMIAKFTPSCLQELHNNIANRIDNEKLHPTSIYHFGYSDQYQRYVRYRFRSELDYAAELSVESSFGVKPFPKGGFDVPQTRSDFINLAERIRQEQQQCLSSERIHIGGELNIVIMKRRCITSSKLYAFADLEEQWLAMNTSL